MQLRCGQGNSDVLVPPCVTPPAVGSSADDILIKQELDDLAAAHPDRFSVYYVLNTPPDNWVGGSGFISMDMIQQHFVPPAADVMVLSCGPKPMCDAMKGYLDQLGYSEDNQFQF